MRLQAVTFHRSVSEGSVELRALDDVAMKLRYREPLSSTTLIQDVQAARNYDLIEQHIDLLIGYLLN
jgi:hypothetical protein